MRFRIRTVVFPLIAINVIIFLFQVLLGKNFTEAFILISSDIFTRPWILLTYMFMHAGISHIFFNMYGLLLFGPLLESKIGPKRFLFIYIGSGIIAGFLSSFFYPAALGASGAIMGMIGTLIILMPDLKLLFLFLIPMPLWFAGVIWVILDCFGVLFPAGIGNIAHLIGMGFGLLYGLYLKKQKRTFTKKFNSKMHLDSEDIEEYIKSGRI